MADEKSTQTLVRECLEKLGKPTPISEVIDYVLAKKKFAGRTPRKTVSSAIQKMKWLKRNDGVCSLK